MDRDKVKIQSVSGRLFYKPPDFDTTYISEPTDVVHLSRSCCFCGHSQMVDPVIQGQSDILDFKELKHFKVHEWARVQTNRSWTGDVGGLLSDPQKWSLSDPQTHHIVHPPPPLCQLLRMPKCFFSRLLNDCLTNRSKRTVRTWLTDRCRETTHPS